MTIKILLPLSLLILTSSLTFAETLITLKDGSQLKGEITSMTNGVYTLKTPIIGDVHIATADVVSINNNAAPSTAPANTSTPPAPQANADLNQQVQAAQAQLMNNPQTVNEMQLLLSDPEIAQLLSDPELVRIVTSRDVNAITQNPKAQALMNNPKMKAFVEKMQGR